MNEAFIINDITKLAYSIRKNAALSISSDTNETLDDFININQVENIIRNYTITSEDDDLILDEDGYNSIFDEITSWIVNVGLAKLAGSNKIECAWDDEKNDMVFWTNE